jgi:hypothetical protein
MKPQISTIMARFPVQFRNKEVILKRKVGEGNDAENRGEWDDRLSFEGSDEKSEDRKAPLSAWDKATLSDLLEPF